MRRFIGILICGATLLFLGCSSGMVSSRSALTDLPALPRVAVLPFENLSGQEEAATKITNFFVSMMTVNPKYELIEFGETYEALRRFRIRSASLITSEQIDSLARVLRADILLTGAVIEFNEVESPYLGKIPRVAFNTRAVQCTTHRTVWSAEVNGRGDEGELLFGIGVIRSADRLAQKLVKKAVGVFEKKISD